MYSRLFNVVFLLWISISLLYSCTIFRNSAEIKNSTYFPEEVSKSYHPKGYTARIIFPLGNNDNILLKGSKRYNRARIKGKSEIIHLKAPFYTATIYSSSDSVIVEFLGNSISDEEQLLTVYPVKKQEFIDTMNFSFLTFGCFQPFRIVDSADATRIKTYDETEYKLRKFFYQLIQKDAFASRNMDQSENNATNPAQAIPILQQPRLILATGDQVYTDATTHSGASTNPISAWEIGKNPEALLKIDDYIEHLNNMYLHFWSYNYLEKITASLPIVSAIDDHEIRDGWGSQGDEYLADFNDYDHLNPELKPYFLASRDAFVKHQLSTGPKPPNFNESNPEGDFHLEFEANGVPVFVFDLRSHRNINAKTSVNEKQMADFKSWLDKLEKGKEIIIVSSLPLFWKIPFVFRQSLKLKAELRDDIADFWSNDAYEDQRNEIFEALLEARLTKNIKPIIFSGDVHVGALSEIWYTEEKKNDKDEMPNLLAYELIVSGFAHDNLSEQTFAGKLNKMAASEGEIIDGLKVNDMKTSTFELEGMIKVTAAKLNFGAYEKDSSGSYLHLFLKDAKSLSQFKIKTDWDKKFIEKQQFFNSANR